jgi:hypothetical protein
MKLTARTIVVATRDVSRIRITISSGMEILLPPVFVVERGTNKRSRWPIVL